MDQSAYGDKNIILNYIPDGKAKAMSDIKGQLDPTQMNRGKNAVKKEANKAEDAKKKAAEGGDEVVDGEEKKLSKKDLKKAAKKADKKTKNAVVADASDSTTSVSTDAPK